jgi:ribonuclease HI
MKREIKDAATARKLTKVIEALQRGETLDRAASHGGLDRRAVVRYLDVIKKWMAAQFEDRPTRAAAPRGAPGEWGVAKLTAYTDGASRGNPGQAACSVIFFDEKNEELLSRSKRLGVTTNNVAEYEGVLLALELAEALGARDLEIRLDSELVVRQLRGEYKVKHPSLKPLHARSLQWMASFNEVSITHIPRKENLPADKLANDELDGKADGTSMDSKPRRP